MSNYFKGMREAKPSGSGSRLPFMEKDHHFLLRIDKTEAISTRKNGDAFIAEFEVVESDCPTQKPGSRVKHYQGLVNKDVAFGQLKLLVYALLGLNATADADKIAKEVDPTVEEDMQKAVDTNSWKGLLVRAKTSARPDKDIPGKVYTNVEWSPA